MHKKSCVEKSCDNECVYTSKALAETKENNLEDIKIPKTEHPELIHSGYLDGWMIQHYKNFKS